MSKVNVDRYQGYDVCSGTLHGNRCSVSVKNASSPGAIQHRINELRNQAALFNSQCAILQAPPRRNRWKAMTLRTQRDRLNNYLTQATVLANDLDRMAKDKNTRWMTRKRAEALSHTVKASCWDTHRLIDIISDTIDKEEQ